MNLDFRTKKELEHKLNAKDNNEAFSELKINQNNKALNIKRDFEREHERFKREMAELNIKAIRREREDELAIEQLKNELAELHPNKTAVQLAKEKNIGSEDQF